jgi:hypothetical protein
MSARRLIKPLPPFLIGLPSVTAIHGFDDVTRISKKTNVTGFAQSLQTDSRGYYLGLLVCSLTNIFTDSAPDPLVA